MSWLALPIARVAVLRRVLAVFCLFDMAFLTQDVFSHAGGPSALYQPLLVRRVLHLPTPGETYVHLLAGVIVAAALVIIAGRLPVAAGLVLALAFLDWVSIGFSYAKIDHDHFALAVALFALPTAGRADLRDTRTGEAAGAALRLIQVACVATYFLSTWAKFRFGGWNWATGATFAWAMQRRGTGLGDLLAQHPAVLRLGQWGVLGLELASPALLFVRQRRAAIGAAVFMGFHLATWLTTRIHFLPLVVCLLAFMPLERIPAWWPSRLGRSLSPRPAARTG